MKNSFVFMRTTLFCFLFVCFFVAQSALATSSSDAKLYYINAMEAGDEMTYVNELRIVSDDFSGEQVVGDIDLDDNQVAMSATVDPKTGEVYFARLSLEGGPPHSDLMILDMETLGVKEVGALSRNSDEEMLYSVAFDNKGQLYGLGMKGKAMEFYKIDKNTGEKTSLASYDDIDYGVMIPLAFNEDDGLFYFILNDVGIGSIDPNNPENLQEVESLESTDLEIYSFVHHTGTLFYTPMMIDVRGNNQLVDLDVVDIDGGSKFLKELDAEGMSTAIFLWSADLIEDEDEDEDENEDYKDCKKDHGNSAYKKAHQRVKYYKKHDHDLYLELQSVYDTYRLSGDKIRKILKQENIETYNKYKQYHRYKKYKECRKLK